MDKKLTEKDGAVLGIKSCIELHEKLKFEGQRLGEGWGQYDAFNFVVTAWHLQNDWLQKDRNCRPHHAGNKAFKGNLPVQMALVLDVLRDLANSSKHLELDAPSASKRVITETHSGEICDVYEWYFHESMLGVSAGEGYYFSIRKLRDITLSYFSWVFNGLTLADSPFPGDLLWTIWRCAPAHSVSTAIPPHGAVPGAEDEDFVSY